MTSIFQESSSKKNSTTLACRFDGVLYDLLQKESKEKNISLNSLINNIAKQYISWERHASAIDFIPLAKETVRMLFDSIDDNNMENIARHLGRTIPRELILLMFNRIDFDSIVSFLDLTLSRYGAVQHNIDDVYHYFIVHHSVNKKFSEFLAAGLSAMGEDLLFKIEVLNADSRILSVKIEEMSI